MASLTKGAILLEEVVEKDLPKTSSYTVYLKDNTICVKKPDGTVLKFDNISTLCEGFTKKEQLVEALKNTTETIFTEMKKDFQSVDAELQKQNKNIETRVAQDSATVNKELTIKTDNLSFNFKIDNSLFHIRAFERPIVTYDNEKNQISYSVDIVKTNNAIQRRSNGETAGMVTLVQGVANVTTKRINKDSKICLHRQLMVGSPGHLFIQSRKDGESFVIKSTLAGDSSTVYWYLEELGE